ncbi:MAG: hypothetical protein IKN27_11285 [Selenomonadaceae bacterium]|nr:hypothetical protein [Selenomonadaceae bacterium]
MESRRSGYVESVGTSTAYGRGRGEGDRRQVFSDKEKIRLNRRIFTTATIYY